MTIAPEPSHNDAFRTPASAACGALFVLVLALSVGSSTGFFDLAAFDHWVELAAVAIALAALFVAIFEARQIRLHARQSVRPHLVFESAFWGDQDFVGLRIRNNGLGPALIGSACLFVDGKSCGSLSPDGWIVMSLNLWFFDDWLKGTGLTTEESIGPQGTLSLFSVPEQERTDDRIRELLAILKRVAVTVEYASFYGCSFNSRWDGTDLEPKAIRSRRSA